MGSTEERALGEQEAVVWVPEAWATEASMPRVLELQARAGEVSAA